MKLCGKPLRNRANSKFDPPDLHRCFREEGHSGKCEEFPYLRHLATCSPKVAKKIMRDSTKTTGAAWKSDDAGPNRISRWVMLLSDQELKALGIKMDMLKPIVVSKLRDKAATYDQCMNVAMSLTYSTYGMARAPAPTPEIKSYLESFFGPIVVGSTVCLVCKAPLDYADFALARRGKAELETAHSSPRSHTAKNVGFAHRLCNIAQGDRSVKEFYAWIKTILQRTGEL